VFPPLSCSLDEPVPYKLMLASISGPPHLSTYLFC
jgi:hypothetical protein